MDKDVSAKEAIEKIPLALDNLARMGSKKVHTENYIYNLLLTIERDKWYLFKRLLGFK